MSEVKERTWVRNTLFATFQPFIPPLGLFPTIIHEGAHWLTAFFIGVPISEIKFGFHVINPWVSIPLSTPPEYLPYFFYSGGLTSGAALLILYAFYWSTKYFHNPSVTNWVMSLFTALSISIQLYLGILEGRYYQSYSAYINHFQLLMFIVAAFICHVAIFYFISRYRRKRV